MKKIIGKWFFPSYVLLLILLLLYSFTQVDLGLALTRFPAVFSVQRAFQYIGYFNRPLSTYLYGGLLLFFFAAYLFILFTIKKKLVDRKLLLKLILVTAGILLFAYNAFSYDIFNYIFDAKIFTFYGKNPYEFKALDFPGDPMLAFMHWTHRVYPYGPVWLALTVPLSYAGMQIFLVTFFIFKLLATAGYLGSVYFIHKIVKKIAPDHELFVTAFFALNPLVIIESLVSGHNDIVMMFFGLLSIYLLLEKRYVLAVLLFAVSIGVKYATVFFLPIFLALLVLQMMKIKIPWVSFLTAGSASMLLAVFAASQQSGNFQPWYLLFVIPFAALIAYKFYIGIPLVIATFSGLLVYLPFLYLGNWDKPVPQILLYTYCITAIACILVPLGWWIYAKKKK